MPMQFWLAPIDVVNIQYTIICNCVLGLGPSLYHSHHRRTKSSRTHRNRYLRSSPPRLPQQNRTVKKCASDNPDRYT